MNFSFVLPSRGKLEPLFKMLDSFERTTKWKDRIEILIALDEGKIEPIKPIQEKNYSFKISFFERPKTKDFTNGYYNWLANRSCGDIIVAFNDDAWMRTQDWDKKILGEVKEWNSSIFCLDIPDTARIKYRNEFPCFPAISRRAFCTLGFLLTPEIKMYPADKVTFKIYQTAERIIPIRNVMIEHEHLMDYEGSKKDLMDIFKEDFENQRTIDLTQYVYKLLLVSQSDLLKKSKIKQIFNILLNK